MDLMAELLMKAKRNEAAQEALGKLVVVAGLRNRPVSQHGLGAEFDDGSLEIQTTSPVEERPLPPPQVREHIPTRCGGKNGEHGR